MSPTAKVRVCLELDQEVYKSFVAEARREGVSVESLLEKVVNNLLRELERDEVEDNPSGERPAR